MKVTHQASIPKIQSMMLSAILVIFLMVLAGLCCNGSLFIASLIWVVFISYASYRVFVTGRIGRWRSAFFIIVAWAFIVQFKANLIGLTNSAFITSQIQEVPYCHIAISSSFLNQAYQQYLAISNGSWKVFSPLGLGILWLLVTLVLGQAWCSWACPYGGLDSGFAKLRTKPKLDWDSVPKKLRDLPAAILVSMMILSLVAFQPVFCLWICPLKIGTGFLDPNTATRVLQLVIFASVGVVFIVVLPWLTKKRAFCGLICPFGAWQSFFGRLNPYRVTFIADKCIKCKQCIKACPTFSIDQGSLEDFKVISYCNRCGECMDACPSGAIDYSFVWRKKETISPTFARVTFLLSAWLVAGTLSLLVVPDVLLKVWRAFLH